MDEAALRAMMPTSFGKRRAQQARWAAASATNADANASVNAEGLAAVGQDKEENDLSCSVLGKRVAGTDEADADADQDDGLTPEERAANREAERQENERRAKGIASDDSDDSDDQDSDDDQIGPPLPPRTSSSRIPPRSMPPITQTATLSGIHAKTLSALAVDASGSRFALGSYDSYLSLYDFGGMTSSLEPFRHFEPTHETYPIVDLSFNTNSSHLLVISATREAKVFTRDAAEIGTCRKGDPYLRDMRRTSGHVSALTCGMFDSHELAKFYTGASDGTVRIWSEESMHRAQHDMIVLKSKSRGTRTKVTAIACERERIWASGEDGALRMWDLRENLNGRPRHCVDAAHEPDSWTSCIATSGETVVTRGGDATVKVWDARKPTRPVVERADLTNASAHTGVILDPFNSRSLITGVSDRVQARRNGGHDDLVSADDRTDSSIVVLDVLDLSTLCTHTTSSTPVRLHWSSHTDQLFATHRNGSLSILYNPTRSTNGITLALARRAHSRPQSPTADSYAIATHTTSTAPSESAKRRRLARARQDPHQTLLPQPPLHGPGKAGRIGAGVQQSSVQNLYRNPDDLNIDPREALLKYANRTAHTEHHLDPHHQYNPPP